MLNTRKTFNVISTALAQKKALECDTERLYFASPDYDNRAKGEEGKRYCGPATPATRVNKQLALIGRRQRVDIKKGQHIRRHQSDKPRGEICESTELSPIKLSLRHLPKPIRCCACGAFSISTSPFSMCRFAFYVFRKIFYREKRDKNTSRRGKKSPLDE
jgi:hypothetical protein